eukprot:g26655.t1
MERFRQYHALSSARAPSGNLPRRRLLAAANCTPHNESVVRVGWGDGQHSLCELHAGQCTHRVLAQCQHIGPEPLNGLQFANAENLLQVCPPRTGQLVNATGMFTRVRQKVAGLELWNTSSVRWARDMFEGLAPGEGPDISSWDLTCVAEINGCRGLQGRVREARLSPICDITRPRPGPDRPDDFYLPIARTSDACSNGTVLLVDWGD